MGKVAKILPEEYKEVAIENKIPLPTVYRRIKRGWDMDKAVMTPTKPTERLKNSKRIDDGSSFYSDRPRTSPITFYFYDDLMEELTEAVEKSRLTRSEFLAEMLEDYLTHN